MRKSRQGEMASTHLQTYHSPSSHAKPQLGCEMFRFCARERLSKHICKHVLGWTKDESNRAIVDDPSDEMELNVNVLGSSVVLMIFR